jgi:hypothetical protein
VLGCVIPLAYVIFIFVAGACFGRERQRIRAEERQQHPELYAGEVAPPVIEYRSRWTFLGLPLLHMRYASTKEQIQPAMGWIAVGNRAYGILCAVGGVAVGAVSLGLIAPFGLIAVGGLSFGLLALGGVAAGGVAIGGIVVGLVASGGFAVGWEAAQGAVAIARQFALGGQVLARHANDQAAWNYFAQHPWIDPGNRRKFIPINLAILIPVGLLIWHSMQIRRSAQRNRQTGGTR